METRITRTEANRKLLRRIKAPANKNKIIVNYDEPKKYSLLK